MNKYEKVKSEIKNLLVGKIYDVRKDLVDVNVFGLKTIESHLQWIFCYNKETKTLGLVDDDLKSLMFHALDDLYRDGYLDFGENGYWSPGERLASNPFFYGLRRSIKSDKLFESNKRKLERRRFRKKNNYYLWILERVRKIPRLIWVGIPVLVSVVVGLITIYKFIFHVP